MPDSEKSKNTELGPKIEQKLVLTSTEKLYLQVLEAPFYLLAQRYQSREILIEPEEEYFASTEDLHHELEMLLPFLGFSDEEEKIAEYIIYNIDSKGRLRITPEELSEQFNISPEKAQEIIDTLYKEFKEEINQLSSFEEGYIIPDVTMTAERIEVRKIEVKDPVISKALAMREETLSKICELVRKANEYFLKGYRKYPQVLTMSYIAKMVGLNISTVSRAVKNKYVSTPKGTLPLRFFFGRIINGEVLKREIEEMLKLDERLTDNQLTILLKSMGINISRRTVNKYRNMINASKGYEKEDN